jgi:hypothetical protein
VTAAGLLKIGDRFSDHDLEWEVLTRPAALHGGKSLRARAAYCSSRKPWPAGSSRTRMGRVRSKPRTSSEALRSAIVEASAAVAAAVEVPTKKRRDQRHDSPRAVYPLTVVRTAFRASVLHKKVPARCRSSAGAVATTAHPLEAKMAADRKKSSRNSSPSQAPESLAIADVTERTERIQPVARTAVCSPGC